MPGCGILSANLSLALARRVQLDKMLIHTGNDLGLLTVEWFFFGQIS